MEIKIALAGNPNSGKTTLFNALTGMNQYVGNWPGVTVEKKEGKLIADKEVTLTDLPGIYSLSPYTLEEVVARNYLINECPDAIINIVDGTNLERNLYLTLQLLELNIPTVVAINMMDVVNKDGDKIDIDALSKQLQVPFVAISALKGVGIQEAAKKAIEVAKTKHVTEFNKHFSSEVEKAIELIENKIEDKTKMNRFFAVKCFERDNKISEIMDHPVDVEDIISHCEKVMDDDSESIVANERYNLIEEIIKNSYVKANAGKQTISQRIDSIVTNRWLALPIFVIIMVAIYYISVTSVGGWVTDFTNDGLFGDGFELFGNFIPGIPVMVTNFLIRVGCADWLQSLIVDGIIAGVGSVLGFVPQMFVLFTFLAFLEGCGYMSRIAFILDRIFRKFGLSGKSFIPILIGTGCGVPGIMASRTIESDADRKMTVITTTFIPCSAKLPIIALIAGALFDGAWWVSPSAYFLGIISIIVSGIILKKTKLFVGDVTPFVMELPAYHFPTLESIWRSVWERGWSFIKKAGTIILLASVFIWAMSNLGIVNGKIGLVDDLSNGFLAIIGRSFAWIFAPVGFGDWKAAVATMMGLVAKENVVGTFGILYGMAEVAEDGTEIWSALAKAYTPLAAYSFLAFNLLCAPCFAAMGAIKREMNNSKWTAFAIGYQTGFAYLVSLMIYQFGSLMIYGTFGIWTAVAIIVAVGFIYMLVKPVKKQK